MTMNRMTAAQAWEGFVGNQTPAEFMEVSRQKGYGDVTEAVAMYVKDIPVMFGQSHTMDELADIANLLAEYIRQNVA